MSIIARIIYIILVISLWSCKKDKDKVADPQDPNENEVITTVRLLCQDQTRAGSVSIFTFKDPDGNGQIKSTQIDTVRFINGASYRTTLLLLNESVSPTDTISKSILKEGDAHQIFYSVTTGLRMSFAYQDKDINGVPIGLTMIITPNGATTGKNNLLKVVLKHQSGEKPKSGTGNSSLGSTDVEVSFPLIINN